MLIFMRDGYQVVAWYQQEMAFAPLLYHRILAYVQIWYVLVAYFGKFLVLFLMLNGVNENNHCCCKNKNCPTPLLSKMKTVFAY